MSSYYKLYFFLKIFSIWTVQLETWYFFYRLSSWKLLFSVIRKNPSNCVIFTKTTNTWSNFSLMNGYKHKKITYIISHKINYNDLSTCLFIFNACNKSNYSCWSLVQRQFIWNLHGSQITSSCFAWYISFSFCALTLTLYWIYNRTNYIIADIRNKWFRFK